MEGGTYMGRKEDELKKQSRDAHLCLLEVMNFVKLRLKHVLELIFILFRPCPASGSGLLRWYENGCPNIGNHRY